MRTRVVLDANIFASALMNPEGTPALIVRTIMEHPSFELVLSDPIVDELRRIFFYPKVRKRIRRTDQEISLLIDATLVNAHIVTQEFAYETLVLDDPDDDIYLIAALESGSRYLVTGDPHLLKLESVENITICTAKEFLNLR